MTEQEIEQTIYRIEEETGWALSNWTRRRITQAWLAERSERLTAIRSLIDGWLEAATGLYNDCDEMPQLTPVLASRAHDLISQAADVAEAAGLLGEYESLQLYEGFRREHIRALAETVRHLDAEEETSDA